MWRKRPTAEEVIHKLREAEDALELGREVSRERRRPAPPGWVKRGGGVGVVRGLPPVADAVEGRC